MTNSCFKHIPTCFLVLVMALGVGGCERVWQPKKEAFPRIDYPAKAYQAYPGPCPYWFRYPVYARVEQDRSRGAEPCWLNVRYPAFNAILHLSYKEVENRENLEEYAADAYRFAFQHAVKAEDIVPVQWTLGPDKYMMEYDITGKTATSFQFYLTDSANHFLRGSLYFSVRPNPDSLAPVLQFLRTDIDTFINSLQWQGNGRAGQ